MLRRGIVASLDYKRKRSVRVCPSSRRRVVKYLKRRQQNLRDREGDRGGPGKATREETAARRWWSVSKGEEEDKFLE